MKKLLLVFAAVLAFAACKKELPSVSITSDTEFNDNNLATATVKLSAASDSEVQVLLAGTPADKLTFHDTVVIPAGSLSADFMVKVNPDGIDPNAPIQVYIKDAIGATVGAPALVTIGLRSYGDNGGENGNGNGNGEGGNGGEGGEGGDGKPTLVSTWTASLDGDPYTEDGYDWVDLKVSTSGIKYYGVEALLPGQLEEYYTDIAGLLVSWDEYIADFLAENYEVSDVLFADGEYSYVEYPGAGAAQIYIVEFDESGKTTGRYGVSSVVFPEFESSKIVPTLVSTWKAEMDGDPYTDEYGDWIDLTMTTPGIAYYGVLGITDDDFEGYYDGIEELILDYDDYIADNLDDGYEVSDLLFVDGEYTYIEYPGEGVGKIYIIEFDASGKATGRYGYTAVTFPEFEGGSGGGELDWDKTTIVVPESFTKNTALGLEYQGRTTYSNQDLEVFTSVGTGDAMWYSEVNELGFFKDEEVHDRAVELAEGIEAYLAEIIDYYGEYVGFFYEDFADFLGQEILATSEDEPMGYPVLGEGDFTAILFTFTEVGDFTGEYNIFTVTVDGHEYVEPVAAPAHSASLRNHFPLGKGLGNLVPACLRHANRVQANIAAHRQAKRLPVISSAAEKSAKKSNKICRLK